MARHYGMPYMGSKQKLVDKIVPFIMNRHSGATDFYDLFGGGGSVSFYALRKYPSLNVHYNELNQAIAALLIHIRDGGPLPVEFVTHVEFMQKRFGNDWYAGYLQTCWSFGNNQKSYLFGNDIEEYKQKYHDTVINGANHLAWLSDYLNAHAAKKYNENLGVNLYLDFNKYNTQYQRRIVLHRQMKYLNQLEHLNSIERLVHLQRLKGLDRLNITTADYKAVQITGAKPVIYCDPPYENTNEYKEGGFNHAAFYEWVAAQTVPVYFSSYKISDKRFKLVKAINTRSLLDHRQRDDAPYNFENVYWNGVE